MPLKAELISHIEQEGYQKLLARLSEMASPADSVEVNESPPDEGKKKK